MEQASTWKNTSSSSRFSHEFEWITWIHLRRLLFPLKMKRFACPSSSFKLQAGINGCLIKDKDISYHCRVVLFYCKQFLIFSIFLGVWTPGRPYDSNFFTFKLAAHHCHEDVVGGRSHHCYTQGTGAAGGAVERIWDMVFICFHGLQTLQCFTFSFKRDFR